MPNKKKTPKEVIQDNLNRSELHLEDIQDVTNVNQLVEASETLMSYIQTVEHVAADAFADRDDEFLAKMLSAVASGALAQFVQPADDEDADPIAAFKILTLFQSHDFTNFLVIVMKMTVGITLYEKLGQDE